MYRTGRALGLSPSEFWGLTMGEFAIEVQDEMARAEANGGLTAQDSQTIVAEADELRRKIAERRAQKGAANGT